MRHGSDDGTVPVARMSSPTEGRMGRAGFVFTYGPQPPDILGGWIRSVIRQTVYGSMEHAVRGVGWVQ